MDDRVPPGCQGTDCAFTCVLWTGVSEGERELADIIHTGPRLDRQQELQWMKVTLCRHLETWWRPVLCNILFNGHYCTNYSIHSYIVCWFCFQKYFINVHFRSVFALVLLALVYIYPWSSEWTYFLCTPQTTLYTLMQHYYHVIVEHV